MGKRITWRTIAAATPLFGAAFVGFTAVWGGWTWGGYVTLADVRLALTCEIIVMVAFPFMAAAIVARPKTVAKKIVRAAVFWALFALYSYTAHREGGWVGVTQVWGLALITYAGLFFRRNDASVGAVGQRWLAAVLTLLFVICAPVGMWVTFVQGRAPPSFDSMPAVLPALFVFLALYELFGVYPADTQ